MADDPDKSPAGHRRIDVCQERECRCWAGKFGISPEELKKAVQAAGPMVNAVSRYLREWSLRRWRF